MGNRKPKGTVAVGAGFTKFNVFCAVSRTKV